MKFLLSLFNKSIKQNLTLKGLELLIAVLVDFKNSYQKSLIESKQDHKHL